MLLNLSQQQSMCNLFFKDSQSNVSKSSTDDTSHSHHKYCFTYYSGAEFKQGDMPSKKERERDTIKTHGVYW